MFSSVVDQSVRFGQKKLLALRIEFRGACERELASVRKEHLIRVKVASSMVAWNPLKRFL
jgi:hypothetical protein